MEQDAVRFYRALGYPGAEEMVAAASLAFSSVTTEDAGEEPVRGDLPPLGPAEIGELQRQTVRGQQSRINKEISLRRRNHGKQIHLARVYR